MQIKNLLKDRGNLLKNFSYITLLQIFNLIAPLLTYPYLTKVLGVELYGIVLTAQMLTSYVTIVVDFGSTLVCAKHISQNRNKIEKLSEIVNSVLFMRSSLFILMFGFYVGIVMLVPDYNKYSSLFILSYTLVVVDVLYPQYFFQGIENMKTITIISIISKLVFISLVFFVVKTPDDYLFVPLLYAVGYTISGIISLYIIYCKMKIRFYVPKLKTIAYYVKDALPLFATDLICTIKDKFNYLLVGIFVGMEQVVVYDLALKLNGLITKPQQIINTVIFPRVAKNKDFNKIKQVIFVSFIMMCFVVLLVNIFLPYIVDLFLHKEVDYIPIRLFIVSPILLSISVGLAQNLFVVLGYNKYILYSIIVTTIVYLLCLTFCYFTSKLSSIYTFVYISLISYFVEMLYRLIMARRVFKVNKL